MPSNVSLQINGQQRSFAGDCVPATLGELLEQLKLKADRVAVEHNGAIVARTKWAETPVVSGDRLEIVHFVGGGTPTPT